MPERCLRRIVHSITLIAFIVFNVVPSSAQTVLDLPEPGQMITFSPRFTPPVLKGVRVHVDNPFQFEFILDKGDSAAGSEELKAESNQLIKYFLAALTVPEQDLWVNLSPYEKDRIITNEFGQTEMGRDLLAQDYILKQLSASVIYPGTEAGKKFWEKVYQLSVEKYGTIDIPVDTFNKVWITPARAAVYEKALSAGNVSSGRPNEAVAYVVESRLKVMLESDYLAESQAAAAESAAPGVAPRSGADNTVTREMTKNIIREVVIPLLEKEVNEGRNFARLRQVYNSLILAAWYKRKIKDSLLSSVYVDKKKVVGVNIDDPQMAEKIWGQYLEAFQKGVFNFVQEERDLLSNELIPRKYFSGGFDAAQLANVMTFNQDFATLPAQSRELLMVGMNLKASRAPDAAQLSRETLQGLERLLQVSFENKTMTDFVQWAGQIAESVGGVLAEEDVEQLRAALGVTQRHWDDMQRRAKLRAFWAQEFNRSLPDDTKMNVYLMRDGLLLFLADKVVGGQTPYAAYLSKSSFTYLTGAKDVAVLFVPAMIAEVKARLGWLEGIPEGADNFRTFKESFYRLYQEMVSEGPVSFRSRDAEHVLLPHRQGLRAGVAALKDYLPRLGFSYQDVARKGVRFIDTTMPGSFVLLLEATVRSYLESQGYQNVAELVDSRMFYSRLSPALSFLNPARDYQTSRVLELPDYPVDFKGPAVDAVRPVGDLSLKKEFLLGVLLFKSEMLKLSAGAEALGPKQTVAGRNMDEIGLITSSVFSEKTGLDLQAGEPVVVDYGVGEPADTTIELKQNLAKLNPNIRVIGTELPQVTARAHIVVGPGRMLDELMQTMRELGGYPVIGDVLETVFVLTDLGASENAKVSEILVKLRPTLTEKEPYYLPLALAPNMNVLRRGQNVEVQEAERRPALFAALLGKIGVNRIQEMVNALQAQARPVVGFNSNPEGAGAAFVPAAEEEGEIVARKEPVRNALEQEGVRFVEAENLPNAGIADVDLITANNVVVYLQDNARNGFFQMAGAALKENGVLVMKNTFRYKVSYVSQIDIYQKTRGRLTYKGSNFSDFGNGQLLGQEWFNEYASLRGTGNRFYFQTDQRSASLQTFVDYAQLSAADFGGIDFTPGQMDLRAESDGGLAMRFDINPALLQQYQAVPGFMPVITSIQPVDDLPRFLGAGQQKAHNGSPAGAQAS